MQKKKFFILNFLREFVSEPHRLNLHEVIFYR